MEFSTIDSKLLSEEMFCYVVAMLAVNSRHNRGREAEDERGRVHRGTVERSKFVLPSPHTRPV